MEEYEVSDLKKKLKSRLNSQRRVFAFDEHQILVLPFLEHKDVDNSIDEIKFLIDDKGASVQITEIDKIVINAKYIIVKTKTAEHKLHERSTNGEIKPINPIDTSLSQLTIEHSPSIQIVLLTKYLSSCNDFDTLTKFTKLNGVQLNLKSIKAKGFKRKCKDLLEKSADKSEIISAYKNIFDGINLEILHQDKNGANLSIKSLDYYCENKSKGS